MTDLENEIRGVALKATVLLLIAAFSTPTEATEPPCDHPIPVSGEWDDKAPGYIVAYTSDVEDPKAKTLELSRRLGFKVGGQFNFGAFFTPALSPESLARLRCEPRIRYIEHNVRTRLSWWLWEDERLLGVVTRRS
jgi:hypothetical protein